MKRRDQGRRDYKGVQGILWVVGVFITYVGSSCPETQVFLNLGPADSTFHAMA